MVKYLLYNAPFRQKSYMHFLQQIIYITKIYNKCKSQYHNGR